MKRHIFAVLLIATVLTSSCKKFLDAKPNQKLSTPSTLEDLSLLMDQSIFYRTTEMNQFGSDDYYLLTPNYLPRPLRTKQGYVWDPTVDDILDWNRFYEAVLSTNTVLDQLSNISKGLNESEWNRISGTALFHRSYIFYQLLQVFGQPYDSASASSDLGIPLRLNANYNERSMRASVQESYSQIISDLKISANQLPDLPAVKTRPSKASSYALLARVYLTMRNFSEAKNAAEAALSIYNQLLDYNLVSNTSNPFSVMNSEVIFYNQAQTYNGSPNARVDSNLVAIYTNDDLRRHLYFNAKPDGTFDFKGSYNGEYSNLFTGLATDELYLIKSEAETRLGDYSTGMSTLNVLLSKRWSSGTTPGYNPQNSTEALDIILFERRKELVNRGTRWTDLRRLNKEIRYAIALRRDVDGQTYLLPPNDLRYTLLIPQDVIRITGMPQNPR